jgi:hypothetical protein
VKLKLALATLEGLAGVEVIVGAGGGAVFIVQVKLTVALWLLDVSWAFTENVWLP